MIGNRFISLALLLALLMAPGWALATESGSSIGASNDALLEQYVSINSLYLSARGDMDPWSEQRWLGFEPRLRLHPPATLWEIDSPKMTAWNSAPAYQVNELAEDAAPSNGQMFYEPIDSYESRFKWKQSLTKSINLSLAMSVVKRPAGASGGKKGGRPRLSASSINNRDLISDGLSASNEIDLWSVGVGLDWLVSNRHGVHLGYIYGGDGESTLSPDLAGRPIENKQAVDLGYIVDLNQINFRLGYVYSFNATDESEQTAPASADRDSTFYLKFQLQF